MREAFAHDAVLALEEAADERAPGGAITVELCGHWEHQPPCPLAPHHTRTYRVGSQVHLRTLFAVEPDMEEEVRRRIDHALAEGRLTGPDGQTSRWRFRSSRRSRVRADETDHAERLTRS